MTKVNNRQFENDIDEANSTSELAAANACRNLTLQKIQKAAWNALIHDYSCESIKCFTLHSITLQKICTRKA